MAKIKVMDELLANKIAAGEVVEKCASVVKELVENSIDAGSKEIKVELIEAGTKLIRVTDDGIGMDKTDASVAFSRHATSKISDEFDLYHINTLGFRGEALAAIASVSDITLKTSTGGIGTIVNIKGGKIIDISNGDSRQGTVIEIKDLFYNTPARLKHLKSLHTELANVTDYMNKLALSYPEIRFTLINNNQVILKTDGSDNLLKTISFVFGMEVTKKMIFVEAENVDYQITGYISNPEIHRSTRNHIITLVNNRVVRNAELNKIINDSYHSYKPDNRYPIVVLNIAVDPILIDVNIHPTKMDIKFSKIEELLNLVEQTIKNKLNVKTFIPKVEVKERSIYEEVTLELNRNIDKPNFEIKEPSYQEELVLNDIFTENEPALTDSKERLPELYPIGLVHGTYIICQNELGMYLIDQHAAKERINYEIYKNKLGNPTNDSTSLLFPYTFEFTTSEFIILKENFDYLRSLNFEIDEFGINSVIIKSHPVWLPNNNVEEAIRKILEIVIAYENKFTVEKFNENIATTLACKLSIKANTNIEIAEMESLIDDLKKCSNPFNCPHGRPVIVFYSKADLEKQFKRSGFDIIK